MSKFYAQYSVVHIAWLVYPFTNSYSTTHLYKTSKAKTTIEAVKEYEEYLKEQKELNALNIRNYE